ncbi:MAG TPA: DUF473 domain-containing protein [Candidatus Acidoferrales bacterium]|nr:DUF473 domain-containing protein [Candidatus Acidoferrales bacterium]
MRHLALTGISKDRIDDLVRKRVRTFELRSAHNIPIVFEARVGDEVFVTDASRHDLSVGTTGVLARVRDKTVSMQKVSHRIGDFYEEREVMAARIQLELREHTCRLRAIEDEGPGKLVTVDTAEVCHYEGR